MGNKQLKGKDYLYIFHHLPKNGGSSFKKLVNKNFAKDEVLNFNYYRSIFEEGKVDKKTLIERFEKDLSKKTKKEVGKIRFIYGEGVPFGIDKHFDKPVRYIVFLRDPHKRAISWYNYLVGTHKRDTIKGVANILYGDKLLIDGKVPSFAEWVSKKYAKKGTGVETMTKHLNNWGYLEGKTKKDIKKMLDRFFFVALTGKLGKDLGYLSYLLSFNKFFIKENVSSDYVKGIKKETKDLLAEKNKTDRLIYKEGVKKRKKIISQQKDYEKGVRTASLKRRLLLPITQVLFDPKGLLIEFSAFLRRKSKLYERYFDIVRGYG